MNFGVSAMSKANFLDMQLRYECCPAKGKDEEFERWQTDQNGKLGRIEKQVYRIFWAIIGGLGAVCMALIGVVLAFS